MSPALSRTQLYDATACAAARQVIRRYSTSFGIASRLLEAATRADIENIYALVRVADEVVDGVVAESGIDDAGVAQELDGLERETERALDSGYSSNLIVHAFALTARRVGIDRSLTRPFFASMRTDGAGQHPVHSRASFEEYIYGSAEVVGLMCLRSFLYRKQVSNEDWLTLQEGARRLGAAFQKINFLRDFSDDLEGLHRQYVPGSTQQGLDEATKGALIGEIVDDLAVARHALPLLPARSRRAVCLAYLLFHELTCLLAHTSAEQLTLVRVRVPSVMKARLVLDAFRGVPVRGARGPA